MTRLDVAAVVIRVIAIWLFVRAVGYAVQTLATADVLQGHDALWIAAFLVVLMGVAVVLWVFASRFAVVLLPRESATGQAVPMSAEGLQETAFSVVGLYLLATALPNVGYWVELIYRSSKFNPEGFNPSIGMYASVVRWALDLAVGLYLLLGARGLVSLVRRLRGTSPAASADSP